MSGWVLESSSPVVESPHCATPPDPQVVPAFKEDEDSVRSVNLRDEGVEGPVEISNDIALENGRVNNIRFDTETRTRE
jgi:hypothetical protein